MNQLTVLAAEGDEGIKLFIPANANWAIVSPLAPVISLFISVLLAILAVGGLLTVVLGFARMIFTSDEDKSAAAGRSIKRGGLALAVGLFGAVFAYYGIDIAQGIADALPGN